MSDPIDLTDARSRIAWDGGSNDPAAFSPADALRAALRDAEQSSVIHVVILTARRTDTGLATSFFQAGELNGLEQVGMIARVMHEFVSDD